MMKTTDFCHIWRSIAAEGYQQSRTISLGVEVLLMICLLVGIADSQSNGDVRLANMTADIKTDTVTGRIEIYLNERWGTICNAGFTEGAALAACRQLGYSDQSTSGTVDALGVPKAPSSTPIVLSHVNCNYDDLDSTEGHILRCDYSQSTSDCSHKSDTAVRCFDSSTATPYDTQVWLKGGPYRSSGILEVYLNNQWGTVCYNEFTSSAADTACRQLGYTNSINKDCVTDLRDKSWLDIFSCHGTYSYDCLRRCFNYPSRRVTCLSHEVVTLNCTFDIDQKNSQTAGTKSLCGNDGLSAGTIVGVVFAVLFAIATSICVVCLFYHKRPKCGQYKPIN